MFLKALLLTSNHVILETTITRNTQPLEELTLDQWDPRKAGLLGQFDNIVGTMVTLAPEQIQREQGEAELKTTLTVSELRKRANKWYTRMQAQQNKYQPDRPQANKTVDENLRDFSKYLNTLTLNVSFHWVRASTDDQYCKLIMLFCFTAYY